MLNYSTVIWSWQTTDAFPSALLLLASFCWNIAVIPFGSEVGNVVL